LEANPRASRRGDAKNRDDEGAEREKPSRERETRTIDDIEITRASCAHLTLADEVVVGVA